MLGIYFSYGYIASIVLAVVIVLLSLKPSAGRYRLAALCYTLIAAGAAGMAAYPIVFGIAMGDAFGPRRSSPFIYSTPLLIVLFMLLPAILLWRSSYRCRRIALILLGASILLSMASTLLQGYPFPRPSYQTLVFLLLWLRVHDMRASFPPHRATFSPENGKTTNREFSSLS